MMSTTIKRKVIDTVLDSMDKHGRPSTSSEAIELLIECLQTENLLVDTPTDDKYDTVSAQVYWLISDDITQYGKASSNGLGAQRAYNILSDAELLVSE